MTTNANFVGLFRRCMQPTLIETFQLKQGEKIIDIVSGINHNLVLTGERCCFLKLLDSVLSYISA
jgi:hypothetical protein